MLAIQGWDLGRLGQGWEGGGSQGGRAFGKALGMAAGVAVERGFGGRGKRRRGRFGDLCGGRGGFVVGLRAFDLVCGN